MFISRLNIRHFQTLVLFFKVVRSSCGMGGIPPRRKRPYIKSNTLRYSHMEWGGFLIRCKILSEKFEYSKEVIRSRKSDKRSKQDK